MKKIINIISILRQSRFIFQKPEEKKIIIFDKQSEENLKSYFYKDEYCILDCRKEKINFYILIVMILKGKKINYLNYLAQTVELVRPKIIITFIDNNITFYELKKKFHKIKFIAIQNGVRFVTGDILEFLKNKKNNIYNIDYYLTFNDTYKNKISKYIQSEFITIGSLKNNLSKISNNYNRNTISYISRFSDIFIDYTKKKNIEEIKKNYKNWEVDLLFYCIELIKNIVIYCNKKNLKLNIIGANKNILLEEKFYLNLLGPNNHVFLPKKNNLDSYKKIDEFEVVVNAMSTLGYEAISRNKKVCFFCGDFIEGSSFIWPISNEKIGNFYSNLYSLEEVTRVLDYLLSIDDKDWLEEINIYRQKLFFYDENNSKLKELIKNLL